MPKPSVVSTFRPDDLLSMMPDHTTLRRNAPEHTRIDIATGVDRFLYTWAEQIGVGENLINIVRTDEHTVTVSVWPQTASGKPAGAAKTYKVKVTEVK